MINLWQNKHIDFSPRMGQCNIMFPYIDNHVDWWTQPTIQDTMASHDCPTMGEAQTKEEAGGSYPYLKQVLLLFATKRLHLKMSGAGI